MNRSRLTEEGRVIARMGRGGPACDRCGAVYAFTLALLIAAPAVARAQARAHADDSVAVDLVRRFAGCYALEPGPWQRDSLLAVPHGSLAGISTTFRLTAERDTAWARLETPGDPLFRVVAPPGPGPRGYASYSTWGLGPSRRADDSIWVGHPLPFAGVALTLALAPGGLAGTITSFTDAERPDRPSSVTRPVRARRVSCAPDGGAGR